MWGNQRKSTVNHSQEGRENGGEGRKIYSDEGYLFLEKIIATSKKRLAFTSTVVGCAGLSPKTAQSKGEENLSQSGGDKKIGRNTTVEGAGVNNSAVKASGLGPQQKRPDVISCNK